MRTSQKTISSVICITLVLVFNSTSSWAQQGLSAPAAAAQAEGKRHLLEEADRVEAPHFAIRAANSPEAVELAHQLEAFAKELQVAWLKRGLDDLPLPTDMTARLSPEGAAYRKKFVSPLEEIATLTLSDPISPPQKRGRKERPIPSGGAEPQRNNLVPQAMSPINQQRIDVEVEASLNVYVNPVYSRFGVISNHLAYEFAQMNSEQIAISRKLDELSQSALKYWGRKNFDFSTEDSNWPSQSLPLRQSIIDLSNRVIFSAILRPEQAEKLERAIWIKQGPKCLLDPELASRLGINKEQRAMIKTALDQSQQAHMAFGSEVVPLMNRSDDPLVKQQYSEMIKQNRKEIDQAVWDLMTPTQISKLSGLLGERSSKVKPPQQKNSSPRPAPAS